MERSPIQVLLSLLWAFSSSSGFYEAIKSPHLSLEKSQCKNNNLPWWHATNGIFIRGLVNGKRYIDIYTSTLRVSDQYQKVLLRANINKVIVDFGEMTLSPPKEGLLKIQNHCQEILEKEKVTVRELSKLIVRLSTSAIAVLPAPLHYCDSQHQQIQKLICHSTFDEKVKILVEARKKLLC